MKFSIARLLIATAIVAVWLTVSLHLYGYVDDVIFPAPVMAGLGGAMVCGVGIFGVCGVWDLAGTIEQRFRREEQ